MHCLPKKQIDGGKHGHPYAVDFSVHDPVQPSRYSRSIDFEVELHATVGKVTIKVSCGNVRGLPFLELPALSTNSEERIAMALKNLPRGGSVAVRNKEIKVELMSKFRTRHRLGIKRNAFHNRVQKPCSLEVPLKLYGFVHQAPRPLAVFFLTAFQLTQHGRWKRAQLASLRQAVEKIQGQTAYIQPLQKLLPVLLGKDVVKRMRIGIGKTTKSRFA